MTHPQFPPFALVIPTRNAGELWEEVLKRIAQQSIQPSQVIILDTESTDQTNCISEKFGYSPIAVKKQDFNHALTRNRGVELLPEDIELVIFMTQDVLLSDSEGFIHLLSAFDDAQVGIAFGRQVAHKWAKPIEIHARQFNYPELSYQRSWQDRKKYGIKTVFCSNAFSAIRSSAFRQVGGFDQPLVSLEDIYISAKLLKNRWKLAYQAEAVAEHSHQLTLVEEMQRYQEIGRFYADQSWILQELGAAEGEGVRFVKSELTYLFKYAKTMIPMAILRTLSKWIGYRSALWSKP